MFARDADTGQAVWFYQMSPHDLYDWDGINEDMLLDLPLQGTHAQSAGQAGPQWLHVRDRSHQWAGALGDAVRVHHHHHWAWTCRQAS